MNRIRLKNKGSVSLENAVLIAIIIAALIGMSAYIRRAMCGKLRQAGDSFGFGKQYDPLNQEAK